MCRLWGVFDVGCVGCGVCLMLGVFDVGCVGDLREQSTSMK